MLAISHELGRGGGHGGGHGGHGGRGGWRGGRGRGRGRRFIGGGGWWNGYGYGWWPYGTVVIVPSTDAQTCKYTMTMANGTQRVTVAPCPPAVTQPISTLVQPM